MLQGTFGEWVNAGAPGEWSHTHADGAKVRVSVALVTKTFFGGAYEDERAMYEVYSDHTATPDTPLHYEWSDQVVGAKHVTWETPGDVING